MPTHAKHTNDEALALLRTLAAQNGGWLSTRDYDVLKPVASPCIRKLLERFQVGSWAEVCAIAGIASSHDETLPETLSEADIRLIINTHRRGAPVYSLSHRRQVAIWCLHQAAAVIGNTMLRVQYDNVARELSLSGSWSVAAAFDDSWNKALKAAGLEVPHETKIGDDRKVYKNKQNGVNEEQIMIDTVSGKYPADWRTREWPLKTLDPVTTVTTVYRHATFAEYGLKYTETRMVLR